MPIVIDIDTPLLEWQAKHGERMTYTELAKRAGITLASLNRLKAGDTIQADLRKINEICKVLECTPADLILRRETERHDQEYSPEELVFDYAQRKHLLDQVEQQD